MTDLKNLNLHPDQELLVDYFCGQLDEKSAEAVTMRLAEDEEFAAKAARINKIFMVLDATPAKAPTELLISRTLAAVGAENSVKKLTRSPRLFSSNGTLAFGMREAAALAALVFIVAAILIPVFNHAGKMYRDEVCIARTGQIGQAMASYSEDNGGQLPATADVEASWLASGGETRTVSNSSNLYKLVSGKYVPADVFICPADKNVAANTQSTGSENDFAGPENISYSYQNAVNAGALRTDLANNAAKMVILADRSPVFAGGKFVADAINSNSANHGGHGQAVLYLDMHSSWAKSPNVGIGSDNIWLSGQKSSYSGTELPASVFDSFLLPAHLGK